MQKKQEERELKRQQGDSKKIEQAMRKESQEVSKGEYLKSIFCCNSINWFELFHLILLTLVLHKPCYVLDISTKTASEERRRAEIKEKTAEVQRQHTFGKEKVRERFMYLSFIVVGKICRM